MLRQSQLLFFMVEVVSCLFGAPQHKQGQGAVEIGSGVTGIKLYCLAVALDCLFEFSLLEILVSNTVIDIGDKLDVAPYGSMRVVEVPFEVESVGQDVFYIYGDLTYIQDGKNVWALSEGVFNVDCLRF